MCLTIPLTGWRKIFPPTIKECTTPFNVYKYMLLLISPKDEHGRAKASFISPFKREETTIGFIINGELIPIDRPGTPIAHCEVVLRSGVNMSIGIKSCNKAIEINEGIHSYNKSTWITSNIECEVKGVLIPIFVESDIIKRASYIKYNNETVSNKLNISLIAKTWEPKEKSVNSSGGLFDLKAPYKRLNEFIVETYAKNAVMLRQKYPVK